MGNSALSRELRAAWPLVVPSLLAADFGNLEREIRRLEDAGARIFHLDVMDGHFVPNISIGVPVVEAVRRITDLPLDVHLMISNPSRYVEVFRRAGADVLSIHLEAVEDPRPVLDQIREAGALAGIVSNPPTPVECLETYLDHCDLVLTMSVMPGFGGQAFEPVALDKLRWLRKNAPAEMLLSVDGGVDLETIGPCAGAGADLFVTGTALLRHRDYRERFAELTAGAQAGVGVRV
ncbi:MAG: ribulose-phosphate 3-epimerase [Thermoguttaceae bacterium]|jgi:ribulose-phosphate 3-epimerase